MPQSTLINIDICSAALVKIGAKPIQSFLDGSREAQVASTLYPRLYNSELASYPWNFASKQAGLNLLVGTPVDPNWLLMYAVPADYLKVRRVYDVSGIISDHRVEGNVVYSDDNPLFMEYTVAIGEGALPEYYVDMLIARCAWEFTRPISGIQSDITDVAREYENKRNVARGVDARSNLPDILISPQNSTLIRARRGVWGNL